jgi:ribonuclease HI
MAKPKFYVVWKGRCTGVFETWAACAEQVHGFEGAVFMAFPDRPAAENAYASGFGNFIGKKARKISHSKISMRQAGRPLKDCLCVDAACSGNPGILEYQGVDMKTKRVIFRKGPFASGTINLGEFLAIVHAIAYLKKKKSSIPVYSDSRTAIKWVKDKAIKTTVLRTPVNEPLFELVDRAIKWLKENDYENKVLKWQTEFWGEIPADFGRK